jgi:hypothetical protein
MINPTIGRVVWYTPPADDPILATYKAPFKADVIYVWGDRCVNLDAVYPDGQHHFVSSATLVQEGDTAPGAGRYAEWPYQQGQAKKSQLSIEVDASKAVEGFKSVADDIKKAMSLDKLSATSAQLGNFVAKSLKG